MRRRRFTHAEIEDVGLGERGEGVAGVDECFLRQSRRRRRRRGEGPEAKDGVVGGEEGGGDVYGEVVRDLRGGEGGGGGRGGREGVGGGEDGAGCGWGR